ncbi:platelet glycoprotein VI [Rhynchocyon petersi]
MDVETKTQVKNNSSSPTQEDQEDNQCKGTKEEGEREPMVPIAEEPKEVTYALLHLEGSVKDVDTPASCPAGDATQEPYSPLKQDEEEGFQPEEDEEMDTQVSTAEDQKEVTYAQLQEAVLIGSCSEQARGTMSLPLLVLFCLALLPKPSLQASPSALVPLDKSVILHCKGPPGVLYRLEKLKSDFYTDDSTFSISPMEQSSAGQYRCSYQKGSRWSPPSDLLELIATGVFSKPTLSALPSSPVPPGSDVILQCQNNYGYDRFALYKEGDSGPSKSPEMWYKADFPISTVTAIHSGTYRCYSFSSASPYLWSHPSDPLELVVKGEEDPNQTILP